MQHRPEQLSNTPMSAALRIASQLPRNGSKPKPQQSKKKPNNVGFGGERKEVKWQCVQGCGACCKLDKGQAFATPEEIFKDSSDIELYKSMVGSDGWCLHYEKETRTCKIYSERPYFCRVEAEVFQSLYGIDGKRFNREACSSCQDTIKSIYGAGSQELENFNYVIKISNTN